MRLIGMGLLAFVCVAIALLISKSEKVNLGVRHFEEALLGPKLRFETSSQSPKEDSPKPQAIVYRADQQLPIILTGLPSYQSATFYMPVDARPVSGHLQIDASIQSLSGVEGVLRISIDNIKRAELLLRPGEVDRSVRIDLTPEEIARAKLVVSFSLKGQGHHARCGKDDGIESIVEIETTSAVFLQTDSDLKTAIDRSLIAGKTVKVSWVDAQNQAVALSRAVRLNGQGWAVSFVDQGLSVPQLERIEKLTSTTTSKPIFAWSDAMRPDSSLFGLRKFKRAQSWRILFDMSDGRDNRLPRNLNLRMNLADLAHGGEWQASITLNGKLVGQFIEDGDVKKVDWIISLPKEFHRQKNVIEIEVGSTNNLIGECNEGPELFAEVATGTTLEAGTESLSDSLTELFSHLSSGWVLAGAKLTKAEAAVALRLMTYLPSTDTLNKSAKVTALGRGRSLRAWKKDNVNAWLLQLSSDGNISAISVKDYPYEVTQNVYLIVDLMEAV